MINLFTAEFLLSNHANSGTWVFIRATWTTAFIYGLAFTLRQWGFGWPDTFEAFAATLPWLGFIFAAIYTAYYARFSSQYAYLADLYNQQMAVSAQVDEGEVTEKVFALWSAAYIEDAEELHLHLKPIFATLIREMLRRPEVREAYKKYTPGGEARLRRVECQVDNVWNKENKKRS